MGATPGATSLSRWEAARLEALELLAPLRQGDVATVILMGTRPVTLTATDDASLIALRERLALVAQPGGRADLDAALALAGDLFRRISTVRWSSSATAVTADPAVAAGVDAPVTLVVAAPRAMRTVRIWPSSMFRRDRAPAAMAPSGSMRRSPISDRKVPPPVSLHGDGLEIGRSDVTIAGGGAVEPLRWLLPRCGRADRAHRARRCPRRRQYRIPAPG